MKRIYIAGPLHRAAEARELSLKLTQQGALVLSTWHINDPDAETERALSRSDRQAVANTNCSELLDATHVILLADSKSRGSLVEAGIAMGRNLGLVIIGHWHDHTLMLDSSYGQWVSSHVEACRAVLGAA